MKGHVYHLVFSRLLSPPSPSLAKLFYHLHHVLPEGAAHKGVEDGVETAMSQGQTLCDLSRLVQSLAGPTVGHQVIDGVHGPVDLHHVVRQLREHKHPHDG